MRQEAEYYQDRGDAVFEQGRFREAADLYRDALDRDPSLERARSRLNECLVNLGDRSGQIGVVSEQIKEKELVRGKQARIEIEPNLADGRKALEDGDVDEAEKLVASAVDMIDLEGDYSPADRKAAIELLEEIRRRRR